MGILNKDLNDINLNNNFDEDDPETMNNSIKIVSDF